MSAIQRHLAAAAHIVLALGAIAAVAALGFQGVISGGAAVTAIITIAGVAGGGIGVSEYYPPPRKRSTGRRPERDKRHGQ